MTERREGGRGGRKGEGEKKGGEIDRQENRERGNGIA